MNASECTLLKVKEIKVSPETLDEWKGRKQDVASTAYGGGTMDGIGWDGPKKKLLMTTNNNNNNKHTVE